jgi:RsiW-degrading membrane proteinase PrsW (M82 family)
MLYCISIIPIFIYIIVLLGLDSFYIVKKYLLAFVITSGAISCVLAFALLNSIGESNISASFIEELFKGIVILVMVMRKKIAFFIDAAIYGAAAGGGFAILENIIYLIYNPGMNLFTAIIRGLGTSIMHMGMTGIVAVLLIMLSDRIKNNGHSNKIIPLIFPLILLPSAILHYMYNQFYVNPHIMLAIILATLTLIFALLAYYNDKCINKWIDISVNEDITLLSNIQSGNFASTNAGKYLLSVKDKFKKEVFLDMCCYVTLYLELSLIAKRNMMLKEIGLEIPDDPVEKENTLLKIKELNSLRKQIGKTGEIALYPIVKANNLSIWIINSL